MTILDDLLAYLPGDATVRSILVGVHWTVVCSRSCGLASTITGHEPHGQSRVRDVGRLKQKTARQLAQYAYSDNRLEASIGVAAINSLLEISGLEAVELNAIEVLATRGRGKNIALVGHFPFIPRLRQAAGQLWVIEQNPAEEEYPAEAAPDLLPRADIVALTGTAIINHTMDDLLSLCQPAAEVMILGPSTPLAPVLFDHGATIISGARVVDEAAVIRTVSQGATFQQVEGVKLLTLQRQER